VHILATLLRPGGGPAQVAGFDVARQPGEVRRLLGLTGQFAPDR
jgi:oleandomycin transport system ATP-binding protein